MSSKNDEQLSFDSKKNLVILIETLKNDLDENEKKIVDVLNKDTLDDNVSQLENLMNLCFELQIKIEDYFQKLREIESREEQMESSSTLMNFISLISNVKNDSGPEALIIVTSEKVGNLYIQLIRRLALKNVIITTIRALTAEDVRDVTLHYVNVALLDGSDEEYEQFVGSEMIRSVVSNHVPTNRLFFVRSNEHRNACFEHVLQRNYNQ